MSPKQIQFLKNCQINLNATSYDFHDHISQNLYEKD